MQAIAREMAFSETTFVLPPETADTTARVRIFTPGQELPMAGHPTIGTTFALATQGVIPPATPRVVLGLGIGPTPVDLTWDGDVLAFARMAQRPPDFGPAHHDPALIADVAAALTLSPGDLAPGLPVQTVSSGVPFTFVPLGSRDAVDRATPDLTRLPALRDSHDFAQYYVFTLELGDPPATVYSRMFAPLFGIPEDPATGGACGPLGGYLLSHGLVERTSAREILNLQGVAMGRPSWMHIEVPGTPEAVGSVRVGGQSVLVARGTLFV